MMKKMRLLISIILMGLSYSAYSMNTVTIECRDGKELSVPQDVVKKVRILHDCLNDICTDNNNLSLKYVDVKLDHQTLQELFNCIQNPSQIKAIKDIHKLEDFLAAGNYLDIAEDIKKYIALRIINYCDDFDELSEKTRSLIKDITQQLYAENKLNLANKRVDSLQNIERIVPPEDRHAITAIDCSRNKLKKLDVKKLKQIFPNLTHLNASCNRISHVDIGRMQQQRYHIDFSSNCLLEQEVEKIKKAVNIKNLSYIMLNGKRVLKIILFNLVAVLRKGLILSYPVSCLLFIRSSEAVFEFMIIGSGIGVLAAFTTLKDFNQRLQPVITEMEQELQRRKNSLNIEYQISPEQQQRIRDRLMAVGKKLYEGEVKKVYGNDGLKGLVPQAVNNSPTIVTRSYR